MPQTAQPISASMSAMGGDARALIEQLGDAADIIPADAATGFASKPFESLPGLRMFLADQPLDLFSVKVGETAEGLDRSTGAPDTINHLTPTFTTKSFFKQLPYRMRGINPICRRDRMK